MKKTFREKFFNYFYLKVMLYLPVLFLSMLIGILEPEHYQIDLINLSLIILLSNVIFFVIVNTVSTFFNETKVENEFKNITKTIFSLWIMTAIMMLIATFTVVITLEKVENNMLKMAVRDRDYIHCLKNLPKDVPNSKCQLQPIASVQINKLAK